jgi:hypothetical protein
MPLSIEYKTENNGFTKMPPRPASAKLPNPKPNARWRDVAR